MIHLDTSVLVDALTGPRRSAGKLRASIESGERILVSSVVLYEWLRGPRLPEELEAQEALFPSQFAVPFGSDEAVLAARLYRSVKQARGREIDLAIASCAILQRSGLWTLNVKDFEGIPDLILFRPPG